MSTLTPHINAWKWAVAGQPKGGWPEVVETHSEVEYIGHCAEILAAAQSAQSAGHQTYIGGKNNPSGGKKIWRTCNGYRLKVAYVPQPRAQAVTQTSRESYAKVNLGEKCLEVAKAALAVQAQIGYATDGEIGRFLNCPSALVSARRNDIEKAGGIEVGNSRYSISGDGQRTDSVTARRVNAWRLVAKVAECAQIELFQ